MHHFKGFSFLQDPEKLSSPSALGTSFPWPLLAGSLLTMISHCHWLLSLFHFLIVIYWFFEYLIAVLISPLERVKQALDLGQSCPLLPGQLIISLQIASNYHSHFCVYIFPPSQFYCSFASYLGNYPYRRITRGYHVPNTNMGPIWNLTSLMQWSLTHHYVFIPFLHPSQQRTNDRAQHFTTTQMFSVSEVTGSCLRNKSSRTALMPQKKWFNQWHTSDRFNFWSEKCQQMSGTDIGIWVPLRAVGTISQ